MESRTSLPLEPAVACGHEISPWQRARRLLALDRGDLWLCVVYSIAIGLLSLITPIAVQAVVNTVSFGNVLQPLIVMTLLVAIGLSFAGIVRVLQAYVVEALQERMLVRGVIDLSRRLLRADPQALARIHPPDLAQRFFEMPTLQKTASVVFVDGIDLLLRLLVGLPLLAFYHPLLLVFAVLLLVSVAVVVFVLGRGAVTTAIGESSAKYEAAGWLEHLARMPGAFRSHDARRDAHARADHIARRYRDARRAHFRRILRHLYGGIAIKIIGATLLLGVGGALVIANQLTLGQLVASELVFAAIGAAMLKLYKQLEVAYDLMSAAHKLGLLLDLPQERRGGEAPDADGPARVVLRDVAVGYPDRAVATGITAVIEPRDRVLLDGDGASGKSTLLDALAATLPPSGGTLELDGVDLRLADLDEARRSIVLLREPELVASSVLGNLRLSRPELGLAEIGEALRVVGLETAVDALPDGLATLLLPSGRPLSRTQTRRLALARALLAKPRLLLVDGALDELGLPATEYERLLDHVLGPDAPWTAVVVSNDARVRQRCTRTLALRAGHLEVS